MDILIAFYKVHYNFGLVLALLVMLALYLLSRRNTQGVLLVLALCIVYNIFVFAKTRNNPAWWDDSMKRLEESNFVDWLWGASTVNKSKDASEQRLNQ